MIDAPLGATCQTLIATFDQGKPAGNPRRWIWIWSPTQVQYPGGGIAYRAALLRNWGSTSEEIWARNPRWSNGHLVADACPFGPLPPAQEGPAEPSYLVPTIGGAFGEALAPFSQGGSVRQTNPRR